MADIQPILRFIKRQLKSRGLTYRDVAAGLGLSEPSVKRLFSVQRLTVARLSQLADYLGFTLAELLAAVAEDQPQTRKLTEKQEAELVADSRLLLVAVCTLNHWTLAEIIATYGISEAEGIRHLLHLEKLGLITLLPGNRIRLTISRDFDWHPRGPIRRYFLEQGLPDFLDCTFDGPQAQMEFAHGMLTESGLAQLQKEMQRLRQRFAELHQEALSVPLAQRHGAGLVLALRPWEPKGFSGLRRSA